VGFKGLKVCPKWKKRLGKVSHLGVLKLTFPTSGNVYELCALSFMMKKTYLLEFFLFLESIEKYYMCMCVLVCI